MKKFTATFIGLFLSSGLAHAAGRDEQADLDLEAAALVQIAQGDAVKDRSFLGLDIANPLAFLDDLKEQVDSVKQALLDSFDSNGNGKIDAGAETEAFKEGIKAIALILGDSNQNGEIDGEDIAALGKLALAKIQDQALTKVCPSIEAKAEASGAFLVFRPVLSKLNDICLAHVPAE